MKNDANEMQFDGIEIKGGDGAVIFRNELDGVTVQQNTDQGAAIVALTVDEALRVAAALLIIANEIEPDKGERETHGTPAA